MLELKNCRCAAADFVAKHGDLTGEEEQREWIEVVFSAAAI